MVVDVPMILADSIGVSNLTELKCGGKKDTAEDMAGRKIRRKKDMRYGGKKEMAGKKIQPFSRARTTHFFTMVVLPLP